MVIANRPHTDSHDALELELSPSWDKQGLTGYQLLSTGEANFSVELPSELTRDDLGTKLAIKIVGRDFLFAMHQPHSKWKDARKLAAQERLRFFRSTPTGSKTSSSCPRVPKEDTLATLQKSPLAIRLGLVLHGDDMNLVLIALSGVSALLNSGTHAFDPDDVVLVSKIPPS